MRAPRFWQNSPDAPGWQARLLAPLGAAYARATAKRVAEPPSYRAPVPVLCIGNINAGGTGKTPTVIALLQRLQARGVKAHVVTRGYGGSLAGPVQVNERTHAASETGDEPLLLAAFAPTWVAKDRSEGARAAVAAGADIILLDDGFQNPAIAKDASIVVVDAHVGFGNGRCIPAGPLREPVKAGLKRADLILTIGPDKAQERFETTWSTSIELPRAKGVLAPLPTGMDWKGTPFVAFAGIGRPEKFFETLRGLGANLVQTHALDDHQPLTNSLLTRLDADAKRLGAQLVTTEKDAVRLPKAYRTSVLSLPVRLELNDWSPVDALLDKLLDTTPPKT
ncbi:tetraacyldisaccharide 4'-kinase [Cognatishimia maritima]|uniref:Tetraacyldisaccharide 4'-kinase n=1 Tax=Cognatishimia maritima TaxID=870908 RepID=A0A1M5T1W1_9RHOB|nr:tetraacyldisaccharide 4'-kinase [Cognatishimia maritima]SHH44648.1 lipid-A-disaccharide kinase [Cognatishimia maritima]